ncbi:MAG: tRNA lysidine(34) synthetase TilS [bacterium]|nr:tRNA lysidine(34) synthetase TilS [bacterium]
MKTLYPLFLENNRKHLLIENGDTVILGFSGGKDSVTLFHLLKELKRGKELDFRLVVAYFNHKLRRDEAKEQQWIMDFCDAEGEGVELVMGSKEVMEFKTKHKLNLEHAASISRYAFFQQVSARYPKAKVATAHTKSDLTETFFIKLFRGSGLQGLSTIYHKKENTIIRPLLLYDQDQIKSFLERNNFSFYSDYTNEQDVFLRNRIRHNVVPEIQKIEPDIDGHIFKTVSIIQAEYDYFSETAKRILKKGLIMGKVLPFNVLQGHHAAVQRHIIREYIRLLKGNLLNIDFKHIEGVRTGHGETGGLAVPGVQLIFHKGFMFPAGFSVPGYSYGIKEPGSVKISETGRRVTVRETVSYKKPTGNGKIIIPASLVKFPLTLRNAVKGDKYVKINTTINQKVFEMIRASGIPSELRNLCPVLLNGDGAIIWVTGSPVANTFKVKDKEESKYLEVKVTGLN